MEEFFESLAVALHRIGEVVHRPIRKISAKHRAAAIELHRHCRRFGRVLHPGFELRAEFFETGVRTHFGFRIYQPALTLTLSPRRGDSLRSLLESRTRLGS